MIYVAKKVKTRPTKRLPNFKQLPDESDHNFMRRINHVTKESLMEAKFEAKYGVDVVHDKKSGAVKVKKRTGDQFKSSKKDKFVLTKEQKEIIKEEFKKNKNNDDDEGIVQEFKRDTFKFGEVVHGPPNISTIPRLAKKHDTVARVQ